MPAYLQFNVMLVVLGVLETLLLATVIPSHLICHQGLFSRYLALPIAVYNIAAEVCTIAFPVLTIIAIRTMKHFNPILVYAVIAISCKAIQILTLLFVSHEKACKLPAVDRLSVAGFSSLELACVCLSAWILKKVKKVDRESKVKNLVGMRKFLSD